MRTATFAVAGFPAGFGGWSPVIGKIECNLTIYIHTVLWTGTRIWLRGHIVDDRLYTAWLAAPIGQYWEGVLLVRHLLAFRDRPPGTGSPSG
jgi:hypothetical protein